MGLITGSQGSPGVGNGNLSQYSCLENSVDREAWQATVHGPEKSWAWMSTHTTLETGNKGRSNWKFSRGKQKVWWWHSWWTRRKYVEWKQWMGATRKLLKLLIYLQDTQIIRKKSVSKTLIVKYIPAVLRESRIFSCLPVTLFVILCLILYHFCTNTFLNLSIDHHIISCYTYPKRHKFH